MKDGDRNPRSVRPETPSEEPIRHRIRHGGSWSSDPHSFPIAYRRYNRPDQASNRYGVRFAIDADEVSRLLERGEARALKGSPRPQEDRK